MMKVVVTGAAGFIGSHLAQRLAEMQYDVHGIDCLTDYYSPALKQLNVQHITASGVAFYPLDLAVDDLTEVVQDAAYLFHVAAQPGISATTPFEVYVRNNLHATQRLLCAAQQAPEFQGLINIATSSIYGANATGDEETVPQPTSHYGVTKLSAEQLILAAHRDQNFPACSLRLFSVFGPRERPEKLYTKLIRAILNDEPFPLFEGSREHVRSYTYVGDVVDGMIEAMHRFGHCNGEILNIGTDQAITTGEGIEIVESLIGKRANFVMRPRRAGDQLKTHANIDKARRLLDYNPTTSARDGLAEQVAWYRSHIHGKVD
jgi:nucleoside-diphosphate-sugar epimerase